MRAIGLAACLALVGCVGPDGDIASSEQPFSPGDPTCENQVATVKWDGKTIGKPDTDQSIVAVFSLKGSPDLMLAAVVDIGSNRVVWRATVPRQDLGAFSVVVLENNLDWAGVGQISPPPVGPGGGGPIWDGLNDPTILERGTASYKTRFINLASCPTPKL